MMIQSDIPVNYPVDTLPSIPGTVIATYQQPLDFMSMVNVPFIVCTITTIYFIIKSIEGGTGKAISTWRKSAIVILVGAIYATIFNIYFNADHSALLLSFVVSTFGYDIVIKPLLRKIGIHYKDYKTTDKPITKI